LSFSGFDQINRLERGWQKWWDQSPVDTRMGLVSEGFRPPTRTDLRCWSGGIRQRTADMDCELARHDREATLLATADEVIE
jgi:hypothetical protein